MLMNLHSPQADQYQKRKCGREFSGQWIYNSFESLLCASIPQSLRLFISMDHTIGAIFGHAEMIREEK